jgi:hypothetical protein
MHFTPEEIDKLPKWAQSKVKTLQMRLSEANQELDRIKENAPSNTIVGFRNGMREEKPTYLKDNQLITFVLDDGNYIMAKTNKGELEINGSNSLITIHKVSNSFAIKINH